MIQKHNRKIGREKNVVKGYVSNSKTQQRFIYTYRRYFQSRIKLLLQCMAEELLYASSTQPNLILQLSQVA